MGGQGVPGITRLSISRYRGIRRGEVDGLTQVNIFIGKNNSGKSSILEAIYLLSAVSPKDQLGRDKVAYLVARRSEGRSLEWAQGKEALWHGYDMSQSVEVGGDVLGIFMAVELGPGTPQVLIKQPEAWRRMYYNYELRERVKEFSAVERFMSGVTLVEPGLARRISSLESLWPRLLRRRLDRLVVEVLREAYDVDAEDLTYIPYAGGHQLVVKLPHTFVRVDDLGDGARYAVALAMVASLTEGSALLIEEPEAHQHPSGLLKTMEVLLDLASRNGIQLFMTTHSLELLKAVRLANERHKLDVAVFFVELDGEGNLSARRFTLDDEERLRRLGIDARFLYVL